MMPTADPDVQKSWDLACSARENSYSPYSRFAVGAALKLRSGGTVTGCNVENASYGGTVCAERTAVFAAVAQGYRNFEHLVVVTETTPASPPCAFCLGVLAEFCPPEFPIYLANLKGIEKTFTLGELLPHPFQLVKTSTVL